jgi:hypothetical protein
MWDGLGPEDGTLEHLKRYIGELGFERAVVFAPFKRWFPGDPNGWTLDSVKGDARFIPFATLNEAGPGAAAMVRECAGRGARGIKFHPAIIRIPINDPALEDFYSAAEELRLPVIYHTGPHGWRLDFYRPALVDEVAQRHPKLPLVIEHLGGAGLCREAYAVMQNNPNVYGGLATCLTPDSTWFVPPEEIKLMLGQFGAERLVFGSDFPWTGVEMNRRAMEVLRGLGLPQADLSLVLSGNIERLVSSPPPVS